MKKKFSIESQVKEFLDRNPDLREALDLINITEKEYAQAMSAYELAVVEAPTIGTGLRDDVRISRSDRLWNSTSTAA